MNDREFLNVVHKHLGYAGKMLSGSKLDYRRAHPDSTVYFNACLFVIDGDRAKQLWHGDVDLTLDNDKLQEIARTTRRQFYITPEHGWRSDFQNNVVTPERLRTDEDSIVFVGGK